LYDRLDAFEITAGRQGGFGCPLVVSTHVKNDEIRFSESRPQGRVTTTRKSSLHIKDDIRRGGSTFAKVEERGVGKVIGCSQDVAPFAAVHGFADSRYEGVSEYRDYQFAITV
jgi:hypothetical protein